MSCSLELVEPHNPEHRHARTTHPMEMCNYSIHKASALSVRPSQPVASGSIMHSKLDAVKCLQRVLVVLVSASSNAKFSPPSARAPNLEQVPRPHPRKEPRMSGNLEFKHSHYFHRIPLYVLESYLLADEPPHFGSVSRPVHASNSNTQCRKSVAQPTQQLFRRTLQTGRNLVYLI